MQQKREREREREKEREGEPRKNRKRTERHNELFITSYNDTYIHETLFHVTQHSREAMVFISLWQPSDGQLMSWIQLKIDNVKTQELSWTLFNL